MNWYIVSAVAIVIIIIVITIAMKSKKNSVEVVSATYGSPTKTMDVSNFIKEQLKSGNKITIPGDMNSYFGRDPAFGEKKQFSLTLKIGSDAKTMNGPEGTLFEYIVAI
jgi:hypothetical protein